MAVRKVDYEPEVRPNIFILTSIFGLLVFVLGFCVYDTYIVEPQRQVQREREISAKEISVDELHEDMRIAEEFRSLGITKPRDFLLNAMKDSVVTNYEHSEYKKLCEKCNRALLYIQFLTSSPQKEQSAKPKADLQI